MPVGNPIFSHSGAFFLGTGSTVKFSPAQHLEIFMLTNAQPTGLAEAAANTFLIFITMVRQPGLAYDFSRRFPGQDRRSEQLNYQLFHADTHPLPRPAKLSAYVGTYSNECYGHIKISEHRGSLWMRFPETGALLALLQIVGRRRSCIHAEQFIEESYITCDAGW